MVFDLNILFLLVVFAIGSYVQASTGFAFGLIVISSISALGLAPIEVTAFVVSLLSLMNSIIGLQGGQWRKANFKAILYFSIPCLPATFVGIWLLAFLGENQLNILKIILGVTIVGSSLIMMLQTNLAKKGSSIPVFLLGGLSSGLIGGLFSTFGPPLTYIMYRQPDTLKTIRTTLLLVFAITSIMRLSFVMATQEVSMQTYLLSAIGFPAVVLAALAARYYPIPISVDTMRRCAYGILLASGISLIVQGW
ncbi:TSUP family transporter [Marinomonas sp. PE14-40]|uniref:TSUP family transporter n=1 Tax=Marinomonas sp. PE14-40 TaxID=3060621 RepID=UPI003F67BABB